MGDLTANFSLSEFTKNGNTVPAGGTIYRNLRELAENLQELRGNIGHSIAITSGYRRPSYNRSVGGSSGSQHLLGKAADIQVSGMAPEDVFRAIETLVGQGKMKDGGLHAYSTFVHYDWRGTRARW